MDILDDLNKIEQEQKGADAGDFSAVYYNKIAPSTKEADYLNTNTGWVYACTTVISDEVANIDIELFKKKSDDEVEQVFNHPVLDLLNKANNFTTKFDLFSLTQQYLDLAGEAPWFVLKDGALPSEIFLLRPDKLVVKAGSKDFVDGYAYRNDKGKEIPIEADELIFIKYPNPTNMFRGQGTLQAAATVVDIEKFSETYNKNFFFNGASAGIIFKTDKVLQKDVRERFKKQIDQSYKGVSNAHKYLILEAGLDAKPLQLSQKDMEFFNQLNWTRDKILGIFRVPRTALGITDDVNRANAEATDYVFAKRTIKPKMKRLIEQLNEFLLPMYPDGEQLYLSFKDPVPQDVEKQTKVYESGIKNGYLTINEVRAMQGLEGIGPAGDIVYFNGQPVDGTQNNNDSGEKIFGKEKQKILVAIKARNKSATYKEKVKFINEKITKAVNAVRGDIKNMIIAEEKHQDKTVMKWSEQKKEDNWHAIIKRADRNEMRIRRAVEKQFDAQLERILTSNNQKNIKVGDWKLNIDNEKQIWFRILLPIISDIVIEEGQSVMSAISAGLTFDAFDEVVQNFIDNHTSLISKGINETTNRKIRRLVKDNFKESEEVIARKMRKMFDGFTRDRAKLIARTETFKAINFATEEGYKQSGVVEGKEWFTALDERVCPFCMPLHGKIFAVGETIYSKGDTVHGSDGSSFVADYETIKYPPLHANCRCGLIPVLIGQKEFEKVIKAKITLSKYKKENRGQEEIDKINEKIDKLKTEQNKTSEDVKKVDNKIGDIDKKTDKKIDKIAEGVKGILEDE